MQCKLERHWTALASTDPAMVEEAKAAFLADPGSAVGFLRQRLRPVPQPDAREMAQWIADLDSDNFTVREKATKQFSDAGQSCETLLRRTLQTRPSLEARRRIESLLDQFKQDRLYPPPERRRLERAVEVLERIGNPDACQLLDALAKGAAEDPFTIDVQGAQARLKRRSINHR